MSVYVNDPDFTLHLGDVLDVLRELPDESVHCCVTSPPYWGLRDYGTGSWDGGDPDCDHKQGRDGAGRADGIVDERAQRNRDGVAALTRRTCVKCGATRVDKQLGLESTPEEYVARMVAVFAEVRRVLRSDGTCWLNIGDSYAQAGGSQMTDAERDAMKERAERRGYDKSNAFANYGAGIDRAARTAVGGLKPKDLVGIPWRLAFALQQPHYTGSIKDERDRIWLAAMIDAEGCIFIHKRKVGQSNGQGYERKNDTYGSGLEVSNTSREIVERVLAIVGKGSISTSTRGRNQPLYRWNLRSNECRDVLREVYPHLIAKQHQARLAIGCPSSGKDAEVAHGSLIALHNGDTPSIDFPAPAPLFEPGWYVRSDVIWSKSNPMPESVTDRPTKAHEYVFLLTKSARYFYDADAIREPAEWARWGDQTVGKGSMGWMQAKPKGDLTQRRTAHYNTEERYGAGNGGNSGFDGLAKKMRDGEHTGRNKRSVWEIATESYAEAHFATFPQALVEPCIKAGCPEDGTVLDPFMGSGTTALVARRLGRKSVGIELNPEYAELAARRLSQLSLLTVGAA